MRNKKLLTGVLAGAFIITCSFSAFAGVWRGDSWGKHYDKTGYGNFAVNEWLWIDDDKDGIAQCYYFDATSFMWHDREKDGYMLNSDGQWVVDGIVQTKQVEKDQSEAPDLQKLIEERKAQKAQYTKLEFAAATTNEDRATGYTKEELFDPVFKYHEYNRYDKLSNHNMTVLYYKTSDQIYYSFKGNEDNGNFLSLEEQDAVNKATQDFLAAHITDGMTEAEKEQAIIQYMVGHIQYGYDKNCNDFYGGLVKGVAQCSGYADTFAWLANAAGLHVLTVQGEADGNLNYPPQHTWNLIELDGKWYQVDVTFEDGTGATGAYVNVSDDELRKDHTWEQNGLPGCSKT